MSKFQPSPNFDSLSPQTTKGDIVSRSTTAAVRVGVGSDNTVLTADSSQTSGVKWASVTTALSVRSVTTTDTATTADGVLLLSGASFSETLYTAVGNTGLVLELVHNGTSLTQVYTLLTTSGQTIGGIASGSYALYTNGERLKVVSDGANWQILNHVAQTAWADSGAIAFTSTGSYVFTWTGSQSVVIGDTYLDISSNLFTVSATTNTTTGTFSGNGTPASTGTLTRLTGSGVSSVNWTSRTITGVPVKGTILKDHLYWRRNGPEIQYRLEYSQSTGGTVGSGDYLFFTIPNTTIDTTNLTTNLVVGSAASQISIGSGIAQQLSTSTSVLSAIAYNKAMFRILTGLGFMGATSYGYVDANLQYGLNVSFPIVGWQP